jgi:alpha-tubulin suppressor-like RCC1 family protein
LLVATTCAVGVGTSAIPTTAAAAPLIRVADHRAVRGPLAGAVAGLSGGTLSTHDQARGRRLQTGVSLTPSTTKPYWACPDGPCDAIVDPRPARPSRHWALPTGGPPLEGSGELGGYDPQDLQAAYRIPTTGGSTQTIALIDAYGYETAESDLAVYRERYGLGPCTTSDGCFRKVNEKGEQANYPSGKKEWEAESALDLDMASAACPACHILLVEAENATQASLGGAVNTAVNLGATEVSNSYSIAEQRCETDDCEEYNADYEHQGIFVTASAGDAGYDNYLEGYESPGFPAASPYVVAVGGTSLKRAPNSRGWSEEVWSEPERRAATGSGCSLSEPKPLWQPGGACGDRTDNDVAAVAACVTPVSVFSTPYGGWEDFCGTSASSPLVAGIEAHASEYARSLPGADAFYSDQQGLFDVTSGSNEGLNGECAPPVEDEYLCHAGLGYDGPTGSGTPDGPLELEHAPPLAETGSASTVTTSTAALSGTVNPQGSQTTYLFEYGTSASYGASVPLPEGSVGTGTANTKVSVTISGLLAGTTYHYRLVARNGAGTSYGADTFFRTAPPTVTAVTPADGPSDGSTTVTISGASFVGVTAVRFGSVPAKSFRVTSETTIDAVSAAGSGTVDISVTTPAGTSVTGVGDRFTYTLGPVLAWGSNVYGELGDEATADRATPVEVSQLPEVVGLAAGVSHSLALTSDGTVMAWGENYDGELGDGNRRNRDAPVRVCAAGAAECPDGPYLEGVTAVSAGGYDSVALLSNGTVMTWGDNHMGQLGSGGSTEAATGYAQVPAPVCLVAETPCTPAHYLRGVKAIAAGAFYDLALLDNGTVMAWGDDEKGQLGAGTATGPETCDEGWIACSTTPVAVDGLTGVAAIAAGEEHSLALLENGTVAAWGFNEYGSLGDGSVVSSSVPVAVCAAGQKAPCTDALGDVTAIAANWFDSFALLGDGTVRGWGENYEGELGDGTFKGEACTDRTPCSTNPVTVADLGEVSAIASGQSSSNTVALLRNGRVMTWGGDVHGALGDDRFVRGSDRPVPVCAADASAPCPHGPYLEGRPSAVAVGGDHVLISMRVTPVVLTEPASSIGQTTVALTATVNPRGLEVDECKFEYGTTRSYGASVPCAPAPGSGTSAVGVSASLFGLRNNTTYHFRVVASNLGGTSYGAGETFKTLRK